MLLKRYETEESLAAFAGGVDEKMWSPVGDCILHFGI
jgi:hypothetical protein